MKSNLLNLPISGEYLNSFYGRKTVERLRKGGKGVPVGRIREPSSVSSNKTTDTFWKTTDIIKWISTQEDLPQHFSVTSYVREEPESYDSTAAINYRPRHLGKMANMSVPVLVAATKKPVHLEFLLEHANMVPSLQLRALAAAYAHEWLKTWMQVRPEADPFIVTDERLERFASVLGNDVLRSIRSVHMELSLTGKRFRITHPNGLKLLALRDEEANIPPPADAILGRVIFGRVEMPFYLAHTNVALALREHLPYSDSLANQLRSIIRQHAEDYGIDDITVKFDNY